MWIEIKWYFGEHAEGESLPARGVWIEMLDVLDDLVPVRSLPARGVWIEIRRSWSNRCRRPRHSPQGECGLKYDVACDPLRCLVSLPARGVWIEIVCFRRFRRGAVVTPRKGSVD